MLTDEQRQELVQKVKAILKKKADDDSNNADDKEQKEGKVTDPLKNMKAIVKHYGTHNRLK